MSGVESLHDPNLRHHLSVAKAEGNVPPKPSQTRQSCLPSASPGLCPSDRPAVLLLEALCTADSI